MAFFLPATREKTLAAAANYADNEAIQALAATVKAQWDAYQAAPEGYPPMSPMTSAEAPAPLTP